MNKTIIASFIGAAAIAYCANEIHYLNGKVASLSAEVIDLEQKREEESSKHFKELTAVRAEKLQAMREAWTASEVAEYRNDVGYCLSYYPRGMDDCLSNRVGAGDEDGQEKAAKGYKGGIFHEKHFKTRDGALAAAAKHGWTEDEASKGDGKGELIWDHNYPRIFKVVETKTGWTWLGKMADLEPVEKEGA